MTNTSPAGPDRQGAIQDAADVRRMFDRIVPRYDLMNRIMTGGRDKAWRKRVARQAADSAPAGTARVLDVATGTGDLAFATAASGAAEVIGLDFSEGMIAEARRKAGSHPGNVSFVVGDAMAIPFDDGTFDACTVGFGLRNMPDYDAAIASMARILKPGGRLVCLEMTPVQRPISGPVFRFFFGKVLPLVGGLLNGDRSAYRYLPESVDAFPNAHDLAGRLRAAGLDEVGYTLYGFGTVAIHHGRKPPESPS
ncbi:MAG TPA: class I SAM-dependent methyltransferase [Thermomicrobiales bacterium]|nr:class I SAM-dependent methyltransferase [Thermomicrobiales bacterium]